MLSVSAAIIVAGSGGRDWLLDPSPLCASLLPYGASLGKFALTDRPIEYFRKQTIVDGKHDCPGVWSAFALTILYNGGIHGGTKFAHVSPPFLPTTLNQFLHRPEAVP